MSKLETLIRILKILIAASGVIFLVAWIISPATWTKPLSYLATVVLPFVPDIFRQFGFKASNSLVLAYEVFLVAAMVLGIDLDWYKYVLVTAENDSYYDKIVHFLSGILVVAAGQEFFELYQRQSKSRRSVQWFQCLFLMGAVALVAVGWECYEFLYDLFFDGNMQELVKSGVSDTMWDMIVSLIGGGIGIVCVIWAQGDKTIDKK